MKREILIGALSSLVLLCGCVPDTSERHVLRNDTPDLIAFVQVKALNLRQCPSVQCKIVSVLQAGDKVTVLSEQNGWYKILRPATGKTGWLSAQYMADQPPKENAEPRVPLQKQEPAMPVEEFGSGTDSGSPPIIEESFALVGDAPIAGPQQQQDSPPPVVMEEFAQ